ncbi:hypothetical protein SE92_26835 [Bradyrhizobium sp. AT1]|uniref:DUF4274 domain-containing protein n=1 Tax=Bradyrhizobium sp. AT1 TaxID=574934 RepID=UPI00079784AE|nr:DUF4274 domain-containing protein [Bradyrhizobium sp. AT1]KYG23404.1 hypothetical protein SE92_26835 [Bradyrhizobium sp. AT1]
MSTDAIVDETLRDLASELADGSKIARYRDSTRNRIMMHAVCHAGGAGVFQGLSWDYFLADVELEARAARRKMRDMTVGSICDTIDVLPPAAIIRLDAALLVYFTPRSPENEAQVDWLLQGQDAATVKRMRQRRHAVHAAEAVAAKQEEARRAAAAPDEMLLSQYWPCPHAAISTGPEDFLPWIKLQTPDTWHIIVEGWDYNSMQRDDVIEWILDQPSCDLGTAAQYFFTAAIGLADSDPEKLSPGSRRKWHLMKCVADNWQRGLYRQNQLQHSLQPSDMTYYDELAAQRQAEGRPLPFEVPGPAARKFGGRLADSPYVYEHFHLRLGFNVWKRQRPPECGKDFPRCCDT